jgi:lipopolysaccharide transport system ATP-binding protein
MSNTIIKVENISKQYRLGLVGTGTISHDFKRWLYKLRGKDDPFLKIGETNDRTRKGSSDYVWALKDINFGVEQGEVLGIIGKNGAGKSTLLKILSRVTTPTVGSIGVKGRMASLLEVGTGFHPELTGRENVFLNGAIMGMSKAEIKRKFDEIVNFSGVERYIDTPVKRYSSGMYVRLAFAVAAYLDPEILIIDEVLAVGDAEFQKKCIGKMKDVSQEGRTVIFVSHNLDTIKTICKRGILLNNGALMSDGPIDSVIDLYIKNQINNTESFYEFKIEDDQHLDCYPLSYKIENKDGELVMEVPAYEKFTIKIKVLLKKDIEHFVCAIGFCTNLNFPLRTIWSIPQDLKKGEHEVIFHMDNIFLETGSYIINLGISTYERTLFSKENFNTLTISDISSDDKPENVLRIKGAGIILNTEKVEIK